MRGHYVMCIWTIFAILLEPHDDGTAESCFQGIPHSNKSWKRSVIDDMTISGHQKQSNQGQEYIKPESYRPIRIKTVYSIDGFLRPEEHQNLKRVLERAVLKIANLLSVKPVDGHLLLPRTQACSNTHIRKGRNKGKCGRIVKGYKGESCLDNFKIPEDHLQGVAVYNTSGDPIPRYIYAHDGAGVPESDFVLYVTALTTEWCNPVKSSAVAYAGYCSEKFASNGRPLAGQVNFCPRTIKIQKFDEEIVYKTAVHELFHALGFSRRFFEKFHAAGNTGLSPIMLEDNTNINRLISSAVVREMKRHFQCFNMSHFGAPLETVKSGIMSHWDSLLMHSSLMTSKEQKPYASLIDPITLAVFEDSGWYSVDYTQADHFMWGKGQGCSFGLKDLCKNQKGFCTENLNGCHHLHLSKARCNVNQNISPCGVFAADQVPCYQLQPHTSDDEIISKSSRCFISTLNSSTSMYPPSPRGRCYDVMCEEHGYLVKVNATDWQPCPAGSQIQVAGYVGNIECPSHEEICTEFVKTEPPVSQTTLDYAMSTSTGISEDVKTRSTPDHHQTGSKNCCHENKLFHYISCVMGAIAVSFIFS